MTSPLDNASFKAWHEREMAQMVTLLVWSAGGTIAVDRTAAEMLPKLALHQIGDAETDEIIFTTDEDVRAFYADPKEVQK